MKPQLKAGAGRPEPLGAHVEANGVNFAVYSTTAEQIVVCLYDESDQEIGRFALDGRKDDVHFGLIEGIGPGARYGLRATGPTDLEKGSWHDGRYLLVDPYAVRVDRPFTLHPELCPGFEPAPEDTAPLVPKAIVAGRLPRKTQPMKHTPSLIYELNVRGYTMRHPSIPKGQRGQLSALMADEVVEHLEHLGVDTIELMPIAAWIDDAHLPGHGLENLWGYNPIPFMAPDPRLCPRGIAEVREVTDFYRERGIAVVLDVVYNHTGEGDFSGPALSYRGLDVATYYRHVQGEEGIELVNDMGTGNTLRTDNKIVQDLIIDTMRFWVERGGLTGFRFDLAPALGRDLNGFDPKAELLERMRNDDVLSHAILIAEPWDPAPGGYQLGAFTGFLEHNDRYRDDMRAFWRGDEGKLGDLASRLAGSADIFASNGRGPSDSVNFLAVHDGFTLHDLVTYSEKHNEANGEDNRDGHDHNLSWNCGVEGESDDPEVLERRNKDIRALLASLFFSRGTPMIQQGDEMGRTQRGNNNAYAQDNEIGWLDWAHADGALIDYVASLSQFRQAHPALSKNCFLNAREEDGVCDVAWLHPDEREMEPHDWHDIESSVLGMQLSIGDDEVLVWINRWIYPVNVHCPEPGNSEGAGWMIGFSSNGPAGGGIEEGQIQIPARTVIALVPAERKTD